MPPYLSFNFRGIHTFGSPIRIFDKVASVLSFHLGFDQSSISVNHFSLYQLPRIDPFIAIQPVNLAFKDDGITGEIFSLDGFNSFFLSENTSFHLTVESG